MFGSLPRPFENQTRASLGGLINNFYFFMCKRPRLEPFKNRTFKLLVFEWRSVFRVRFSSPYCIVQNNVKFCGLIRHVLDREIRDSNLGGDQKPKKFFILSNRREETQKDDAEDIKSSRIGSR